MIVIPSKPARRRSARTRSKYCACSSSSACGPELVATTWWPSSSRTPWIDCSTDSSSSTTRTRGTATIAPSTGSATGWSTTIPFQGTGQNVGLFGSGELVDGRQQALRAEGFGDHQRRAALAEPSVLGRVAERRQHDHWDVAEARVAP